MAWRLGAAAAALGGPASPASTVELIVGYLVGQSLVSRVTGRSVSTTIGRGGPWRRPRQLRARRRRGGGSLADDAGRSGTRRRPADCATSRTSPRRPRRGAGAGRHIALPAAVELFIDAQDGATRVCADDAPLRWWTTFVAGWTACPWPSSWPPPVSVRLTVATLAERLDDRFRLLTGGARTALPRQQTLRAVVDWSYDAAVRGRTPPVRTAVGLRRRLRPGRGRGGLRRRAGTDWRGPRRHEPAGRQVPRHCPRR